MNESSNLSGVLDNNTYNNSNSTNVNSTDCEDCLVDIRKLNNVVPLLYFRIIIIAVISVCILLQLATAVLISKQGLI